MQMGMQVTLITSSVDPGCQDCGRAGCCTGAIVEMAREAGLCIRSVIDAYQGFTPWPFVAPKKRSCLSSVMCTGG